MAKVREEIVGKRFLSVSTNSHLKNFHSCDWRSGVIRASTHNNSKHTDLQVLVEYDDVSWQRREWVHVYRDQTFQLFLLEHTVVWAPIRLNNKRGTPPFSPALIFEPLVDEIGLSESSGRPVEHLSDRSIQFYDKSDLQSFQENSWCWPCLAEGEKAVRNWIAEQDGQRILCTTPSVLLGFRVQVYRSEGTTQWYTAVIVGYNESTRELTVTDDTVLEEHSEDPSLVHIRLLGEGVVESILRGDSVGITPRRSRSSNNNQAGVRHIRRDPVAACRGRKSSVSRVSNPSFSPNLSPSSPSEPISRIDNAKSLDSKSNGELIEEVNSGKPLKKVQSPSKSAKDIKTGDCKAETPSKTVPTSPENRTSAYDANLKNEDQNSNSASSVDFGRSSDTSQVVGSVRNESPQPPVGAQIVTVYGESEELCEDSSVVGSVTKSTPSKDPLDDSTTKEIRVKSDLFCRSESTSSGKSVCQSEGGGDLWSNSAKVDQSNNSVVTVTPVVSGESDCKKSVCVATEAVSTSTPLVGLAQSLAVAGTVGGRAVTITATSGPAPQGSSRVASPPSVSITAVVRGAQHQLADTNHVQDGVPHLHQSQLAQYPSSTRMDQCDGSSDSGVSVTERSVSRSSVLSDDRSSSAEVKPNTPTPHSINKNSPSTQPSLAVDRKENVKVWRNPAVLSQPELSIRHIQSLQHSMSQHYPNVPPPHVASAGTASAPPVTMGHSIGLPYAPHAAPPLHIPHGLQPSLPAALYSQINPDVWKQLNHVSAIPSPYAGILPRHQEELYLEERARHSERMQREQETRDKIEKEKMEREREQRHREKREREERAMRGWGGDKEVQLVDQHFQESFRLAGQKGLSWNNVGNSHKMESRDTRNRSSASQNEMFRKITEGEKMIHEGIHKAFRSDDSHKPHPPPPAHSKHASEKVISTGLGGYGSHYPKDAKSGHSLDRSMYRAHDKSVIVQPELKYDKVPHSNRSMGRQSPYASSAGPSPYKSYESSSPHTRGHMSSSPNTLEITKSRQTTTSPHTVPSDRYYNIGKTIPQTYPNAMLPGLMQSHLSVVPPKSKVSSPPPRVYGKPLAQGLPSGLPKMDTRPSPISLSKSSMSLPPPAHTHRQEARLVSESRPLDAPYDARTYPNASVHPKLNSTYSPRIPLHTSPQAQPLDLGRRDALSPNRRRPASPLYQQENKTAKLEVTPVLSRVSEASPLYFPAANAITTVENIVATNLQRTPSPQVKPSTPSNVKPSTPSPRPEVNGREEPIVNGSEDSQSLPSNLSRHENSSPVSKTEEQRSPTNAGYVHKLKKAWLQRHVNATDMPSNSVGAECGKIKSDSKSSNRKVSKTANMSNGKKNEESSTDTDDSSSQSKKNKRRTKRGKRSSESESDKESDGSEESVQKCGKADEPRKKRGRKPKQKAKEEEPKLKKLKEDPSTTNPLQKPPFAQLRKTGESFLQDRPCFEVAPKLPKCRECRWTPYQRNKKMPNIFCRFYAFRRLRYTKSGQLAVAGFSDPVKDAFGGDLRLWVPHPGQTDLDEEKSQFLLTHVADQFCDLFQQEKDAMALHMGEDKVVAWKRVVQGVREMCDVCETTLFNIHWACSKCGFVVCIDCYNVRKKGTVNLWDTEEGAKERDKYSWLLCASRVAHEQDKLMLTQIIAGNALTQLGKKIHEIRYKRGIPMYCGCAEANKYKDHNEKELNGNNEQLVNGQQTQEHSAKDEQDMSNSPLNFFADVALLSNDKRDSDSDSDSDSDNKDGKTSTLRELLVRPNSKLNSSKEENSLKSKEPSKKKAKLDMLDDVISCVIDRGADKDNKKDLIKVELKHFIRKYNYSRNGREPLPIRIMTKTESRLLYPKVAHSWLCDGKLLRLHDPHHPDNVVVFQDQWKRGQPVIVSGVGQTLDKDLWKPQSFSRDFGDVKNNLINCLTNNIVPNQPMKKFWEGFENFSKRLKDDKGQPMVLKLKDWPSGEDFAEVLPSRFQDLMKVLPMGDYTRRNGKLNLAGRLPDCFVRPDLGPKMYIAYGSAGYSNKASTNLHLDISDAVNVMCHVGIPKDVDYDEHYRDTLKAIDEASCDILTRQRVREKEELPGALWHIYHARDSDKIRDLLNKVAIEKGKKLEPHHDPIHDQSWYLDGYLRERLYKEYGVEGYAIVQCMGDAVFIPAGAPHQVRNLHNCIKVAEDFVSPENVAHCFHLTQEFRHLSDTHTNHEDKLQIKNIIYHAMKDAAAILMNDTKVKQEQA